MAPRTANLDLNCRAMGISRIPLRTSSQGLPPQSLPSTESRCWRGGYSFGTYDTPVVISRGDIIGLWLPVLGLVRAVGEVGQHFVDGLDSCLRLAIVHLRHRQ